MRGQAMVEYLIAVTILTVTLLALWMPLRHALVTHAAHLDQVIRRPVP